MRTHGLEVNKLQYRSNNFFNINILTYSPRYEHNLETFTVFAEGLNIMIDHIRSELQTN